MSKEIEIIYNQFERQLNDFSLLEKQKEIFNLLIRASDLVGNPGTNISASTDIACDNWQKDFQSFIKKI